MFEIGILDLQEALEENKELSKVTDKIFKTTKQKTGFGYKQFFICKNCSNRRTSLYVLSDFKTYCRSCSPINIYKGLQHTKEGSSKEIDYRMDKISKKYKIGWKGRFDYKQVERPKHMRIKKFERILLKLQILSNMRSQSYYIPIIGVYPSRLSRKAINKILESEYITFDDIEHISKYVVDWKGIYREIERLERQQYIDIGNIAANSEIDEPYKKGI